MKFLNSDKQIKYVWRFNAIAPWEKLAEMANSFYKGQKMKKLYYFQKIWLV